MVDLAQADVGGFFNRAVGDLESTNLGAPGAASKSNFECLDR